MISGSCHCGKVAFRIEGDIPARPNRLALPESAFTEFAHFGSA